MKNPMNLKAVSLRRLKVGQAAILGPYRRPTSVQAKIAHMQAPGPRQMPGTFSQRQLIVVDVDAGTARKFYLVTRTT